MSWLETIVLAVVQGLTEFLPVSSSGHLALAQAGFGLSAEEGLPYDIVLHVATAGAALAFYRREVAGLLRALFPPYRRAGRELAAARRILVLIAVAYVPTGLAGFALKDLIERLFDSPGAVALGLFTTGALLLAVSRRPPGREDLDRAPWWKGAIVGIAQGIAIAPGISRSGSTISAALFLGLRREEAVRYSFLLSIPAVAGAALLKARGLRAHGGGLPLQYLGGFIVAAVIGYVSISLVLRWTRRGKLWYLGVYCWILAGLAAWHVAGLPFPVR